MRYLISFPNAAMVVPDGEWEPDLRDWHAVIEEVMAPGVYVFGGGIDESVPPALVSANQTVADGGHLGSSIPCPTYHSALGGYTRFIGIQRPDELRSVTRAQLVVRPG